ncbi:hypothetical protein SUDANB15_02515 [Streptomyces sp. enrichment culture]|uniref:hypothetical protein n=1 Tax=Streptomyces sp. enrichment culture TaxID=1795815 RepID=UPI003F56BE62
MQTFTSTELNRKSGAILQAAEEQGSVEIRKGSKVYVLQYVRTDSESDTYVRNEPSAVGGDEVVELLREQTALLRELVEQGRGVSGGANEKSQVAQVVDPDTLTAQVGEGPRECPPVRAPASPKAEPSMESPEKANSRHLEKAIANRKERMEAAFKASPSRPSVEGWPARVRAVVTPEPEPAQPEEPSPEELQAAHEYFGLRETSDGLEITERGIQSALGAVKKIARQDPESAEAKVMTMGPADEDRIEFLRCVQLDKLSKALAKRAAGDPKWLGVATPPRF